MNGASWICLSIFAAAAVVDWWAVARRNKPAEYVTKPLALAALVVFAVVVDPTVEGIRAWWVAALAFSLAGDVFLMLPRDLFIFGLVSFLVGHVAYVGGFLTGGEFDLPLWLPALVLLPVVIVLLRAMLRGPGMAPALRAPVVIYVTVISAMAVCAIATGSAVAVVGAVLFMTSDSLIGWRRFVAATPWMPVAIIVTYHLGQLGLSLYLIA